MTGHLGFRVAAPSNKLQAGVDDAAVFGPVLG